jgi:hypothetical protein
MVSPPMPLASRIAFQFDRGVQSRGVGLFHGRAVRVLDESPRHLHAVVTGGRQYDVRITHEKGRLLVFCECPYFTEYGKCKHLWATILEADRRGALAETLNAKYLTLEDDFSVDLDEDAADLDDPYRPPGRLALTPAPPPPQHRIPAWQEHLTAIQREIEQKKPPAAWPREFEILYVVDLAASRVSGAIVIELFSRTRKKNGDWSAQKAFRATTARSESLPDPADVDIVTALLGGQEYYSFYYQHYSEGSVTRKALPSALALKLIPSIAATGRLRLLAEAGSKDLPALEWDAGEPWRFSLDVRQGEGEQWTMEGSLRRGEELLGLDQPLLLLESGLLITPERVGRFDHAGAFSWLTKLRTLKRISFLDRERDAVLERLLESAVIPPLRLDEPLRFEERRVAPRLGLRVTQQRNSFGEESFLAHLLLDYGQGWMEDSSAGAGVWLRGERVYAVRDVGAESGARKTLRDLGLKPVDISTANVERVAWRLAVKPMPRVVRELLLAGWHVEAEGKAFRQAGPARVDVSSGIDWFELRAEVDYGDATVSLPVLLEALRRGDTMVPLGDGSFGLLPEEWLQRFAPLAGLGTKEEGQLRFRRNQAGLLDALLAAQPEVRVDEVFDRVRQGLRSFQGVRAAAQPKGFVVHLRDYQREGVGWM